MSKQTLQNLEQAITEHMQDIFHGEDPMILTDWFVSWGCTLADVKGSSKVAYASSDSSIQGAYGIGRLGLKILENDFTFGNVEDDE